MLRSVVSLLLLLSFTVAATGQGAATVAASAATPPSVSDGRLLPGQSITDARGRRVEHTGSLGGVNVRFTGRVTRNGTDYVTTGDVVLVTVPASSGADGISVNTNGQPTEVQVDRNGTSSAPNTVLVVGGHAAVHLAGDYSNLSIGGASNSVRFSGNNNTGLGQVGSGGNVHMGGRGNSWSGGGGWTVRN